MTAKTKAQASREKVEADLDEALKETFPASDPPQMTEPPTEKHAAGKAAPRKPPKKAKSKS